ncbi:MAG: tRNA (N6-isopentenyl adenosine(37)-C2)-methylthiotransferase MiaB [Candidatus Moranbacteria bacterium]|nr:tRNA (N6-isopentenyl adenosine(37)-C2)-methylthiotransferase MiaB [Candidatus Moranbacteria bacterium]
MKYFVKVFGCQMNQSDAERIATYLEKYKLKLASSIDEANLIVFVTCGVRQSAEDRVYGQINNIKKKYLDKKIVLTGCLSHRKDVQRRLKGKVDLFCEIKSFPQAVSPFLKGGLRGILNKQFNRKNLSSTLPLVKGECFDYLDITLKYTNSYTAYIPIMTGCNNFCAYCVVPFARGREYSRPADDILKEVKSLVKKGCKEIILLGQNVNSYKNLTPTLSLSRRGSEKKINFPKLLRLIEKIPGKFWLSFLTSHPKDMSDDLIEIIAKSKKICEYISLPAQSGDNEILRKMNRKYSIEHYKRLIKKIRGSFQRFNLSCTAKVEPCISTDIIVGFPGETKKQFENTAKLLREMKFDMAYIAQYSPRPQTLAWKMKDNVSKKEKERRDKMLTDILSKTALENNKKYIGKVVEVLVDKRFDLEEFRAPARKGKVEPWMGKYLAHTRTQKKVIFHSNKKIPVGIAPHHNASELVRGEFRESQNREI